MFFEFPGGDPGSKRAFKRFKEAISKAKKRMNAINNILSNSYPKNYKNLEKEEKQQYNKILKMQYLISQLQKIKKSKKLPTSFTFGPKISPNPINFRKKIAQTKSLDRSIVNAKISPYRNGNFKARKRSRSPNRRTIKFLNWHQEKEQQIQEKSMEINEAHRN